MIVALRQWGEGYLFSRGEKRFQVLDKRTRKPPRLEVQNEKEIVTANDLELVTVKLNEPSHGGRRQLELGRAWAVMNSESRRPGATNERRNNQDANLRPLSCSYCGRIGTSNLRFLNGQDF